MKVESRPLLVIIFAFVLAEATARHTLQDSLCNAKKNAQIYFAREKSNISPEVLFMMNYLCRYYQQPSPVGTKQLLKMQLSSQPNNHVRFFGRLAYPRYKLSKESYDTLNNHTDRLTLSALYCDVSLVSEDSLFAQITKFASSQNMYHKTHALLAFHFAVVNSCIANTVEKRFAMAEYSSLKFNSTDDVHLITDDMQFEWFSFMKLCNHIVEFPSGFLEYLLNSQQPDGGWKSSLRATNSSAHTTMLAYLILMQCEENLRGGERK